MVITFKKLFNLTFFFLAFAFFFSIFLTSAMCFDLQNNGFFFYSYIIDELLELNTSILQTSDSLNLIAALLEKKPLDEITNSTLAYSHLELHLNDIQKRFTELEIMLNDIQKRFTELEIMLNDPSPIAISDDQVIFLRKILLESIHNYVMLIKQVEGCTLLIRPTHIIWKLAWEIVSLYTLYAYFA
jgi:hypothetical protein